MTAAERAHVVQQLRDSEKQYLASIEDVTEAQWTWKPACDRWSVGETAEHIMHAEVIIFRRIQQALLSPSDPHQEAKTAGKAKMLERMMPDRTQKATAPEVLQPKGLSKPEVVRRFRELRAQIIQFAEQTQVPLEQHAADHPFPGFNTLNAYQWLLLVPLHSRRHDHQIAEVKATLGYPEVVRSAGLA